MEKNRLEAFSDGVLAIIITIMVLELKQPVGDGFQDLLALGPTLIAYLLSYLFIAIYWVNHHHIFHDAQQINVKILWCNIAWLFVLSFIPFSTAWVGSHPSSPAPLSVYFGVMCLACITFHLMVFLIDRENGKPFKMNIRNDISLITYFAASIMGGFFPVFTFIVVGAVTCWWIVPEKKGRNE